MIFVHEKEANSILPKSELKYLVAVNPSIVNVSLSHWYPLSGAMHDCIDS